jgi:lipopolysaccharide/colanic/teichoic acid biosynthesis glycosyltransferase
MYRNFFKRLLDFMTALVALLVLSPIFVLVCLVLAVANQGQIFFIQPRPGRNEKIFRIIKFRTMNNKKDSQGQLLPDAQRLTAAGRLVRKTSLDEVPQLINVLKGEMSLVGPRPLLVKYLPLYSEKHKRRHELRPGITGWAQVNGRNAIGWQQKFDYDVWYAENISFGLDMKIVFLTLKKVVAGEGISQHGQATIEEFNGNN